MNFSEAFLTALSNLRGHKLRSSLTMLGIIFGVGAVIAMLAIGSGAEREALAMIERLGIRHILVRDLGLSGEELQEVRRQSLGVSPRDAAAIAEAVLGVERVVPRIEIEPWRIFAHGRRTEARVSGVAAAHAELFGLELSAGRFIDPLDERGHAQVCVIGAGIARELYGLEPALGKLLKVNDTWLEVVGVLATRSAGSSQSFQGVELGGSSEEIYVPASTARRKFARGPSEAPWDELVVRLEPSAPPRATAASIRLLLDHLHGGAEDFEIVVPEALLEQSRRTQRLFTLVLSSIAGISLLVGGIGIMNIMLATVLERTREVGVRRAVGASRNDIRNQFLIEAFSISLLGGAVGIATGLLIAGIVATTAGWPTVVTPGAVALATGVSLTVGLISGIYPALRAAELDPIDALRYE